MTASTATSRISENGAIHVFRASPKHKGVGLHATANSIRNLIPMLVAMSNLRGAIKKLSNRF